MSIRDASFGELFKFGFWIQMALSLLIIVVMAVVFSLIGALSPAVLSEMAASDPDYSGPDLSAAGGIAIVVGVWLIALVVAIASAIGAAIETLFGVLVIMMWRALFMRRPARSIY